MRSGPIPTKLIRVLPFAAAPYLYPALEIGIERHRVHALESFLGEHYSYSWAFPWEVADRKPKGSAVDGESTNLVDGQAMPGEKMIECCE